MARFSASRWAGVAERHHATLASLFAAPIRMLLAQTHDGDHIRNELRAVLFSQNVTEVQLEERINIGISAAANQHTHAMTGTAVAASSVGLGQKGRS